jgi:hypothetical protein
MPVRRSSRLAAKPRVSYVEQDEETVVPQQSSSASVRRSSRLASKNH